MIMNQTGMNPMIMNQTGMNPMIMNQTGMNPIQMNQMGMNPMEMNNFPNQINQMDMDNTTMNIKNIVYPYEKKIKELEEIIRQKDFEITVLKQKLNKNNSNINFMEINPIVANSIINQMNISENINFIQQKNDKGGEIYLRIKQGKEAFNISCFQRDKISKIREKCNIKEKWLINNYRVLLEDLSFLDYGIGIMKYAEIEARSVMVQNVMFQDTSGILNNIALVDDCPLFLRKTMSAPLSSILSRQATQQGICSSTLVRLPSDIL